ncbi:hypothetical protein NP233_g3409 [Leucocoprinus birnbaumii]|uniref:Uncharacterized protein n=1 Tax=Leucocoprinus birnbaumii TaxID=56174 RepID=A0AAD5W323_9AGAR|nr:hypothetical protein NP233_g3409 [Leucocoprinus birnbaumii]
MAGFEQAVWQQIDVERKGWQESFKKSFLDKLNAEQSSWQAQYVEHQAQESALLQEIEQLRIQLSQMQLCSVQEPSPGLTYPKATTPLSSPAPKSRQKTPAKSPCPQKPASQVYQLLEDGIPPEAKTIKRALNLHIRVLWGITNVNAAPPAPNKDDLVSFNAHFSSTAENNLYAAPSGPELIEPYLIQIGTSISPLTQKKLASDIKAILSAAYDHIEPNKAYIQDMPLLIKIYDHFIHHSMYHNWKRECRQPGSLCAASEANLQYGNRSWLAAQQSTSDDEADPSGCMEGGHPVFWIRRHIERSTAPEQFIQLLDKKREENLWYEGKRCCERLWLIPTNQQPSIFTQLPYNFPIDYFNPTFFGSLQHSMCKKITSQMISLLPDIKDTFSGSCDEQLSNQRFMDKYGDDVLACYKLDDLYLVDDDDEEEEFQPGYSLDDDDFIDDEEDDDIEEKQLSFAGQMMEAD